jgi:hypothetical protein
MSRPVRNLRREGSAANTGPTSKKGPTGTSAAFGALTKTDGRAHLGGGKFETQSTPHFDGNTVFLNKFDGH